jgi:hypothetical protein
MLTTRLPLSMWLRHPVRAGMARFLAGQYDSDPGEQFELEHEAYGLSAANRLIHKRTGQIARIAGRGMRTATRAHLHCEVAVAALDRARPMPGRVAPITVTARQCQRKLAELAVVLDRGVFDEGADRWALEPVRTRGSAALAILLQVVAGAALFFAAAFLFTGARPDVGAPITAAVIAVFMTAVQLRLATALGAWLWAVRHDAPTAGGRPPRLMLLVPCAGVLVVLSGLCATAVLLQVLGDLPGGALTTTVALALACCVLTAPWILVLHGATDGSPLTRRASALSRVVGTARREQWQALRRADRDIASARRRHARMQRELCHVRLLVGNCYLRPHRTILLARGLAGLPELPGPEIEPTAPRSALPIRLPADLSFLTTSLAQLDTAIDRAVEARLAATDRIAPTQEHLQDRVTGGPRALGSAR